MTVLDPQKVNTYSFCSRDLMFKAGDNNSLLAAKPRDAVPTGPYTP